MSKDLVVTPLKGGWRDVMYITHAATWDGEGSPGVYIWCWGDVAASMCHTEPEGTPVLCLFCLAYGPRGEWDFSSFGITREESREGSRIIAVDMETRVPR